VIPGSIYRRFSRQSKLTSHVVSQRNSLIFPSSPGCDQRLETASWIRLFFFRRVGVPDNYRLPQHEALKINSQHQISTVLVVLTRKRTILKAKRTCLLRSVRSIGRECSPVTRLQESQKVTIRS
jgi:hypothetical protein